MAFKNIYVLSLGNSILKVLKKAYFWLSYNY